MRPKLSSTKRPSRIILSCARQGTRWLFFGVTVLPCRNNWHGPWAGPAQRTGCWQPSLILTAYHGRLAKARQLTDGAVRSARQDDIPEAAAEWRVNEALREADIGNAVRARQSAEEALALSTGPDVELRAALALARAGDAIRAQKLVDNFNREFPLNTMMQNYWLPSIRAAVELEKNEPAKAIELLKAALPYELGSTSKIAFSGYLYPAYIRGQAYLRAGQWQQAAAEFQFARPPGNRAKFCARCIGASTARARAGIDGR